SNTVDECGEAYESNDNSLELTTHAATNTKHSRNRSCRLESSVRRDAIHVISQVDYMNSFGNNGGDKAEAVAWLEKRIHHLKDEMLMVETRLEKMRHEHLLLKTYLTGLEQFESRKTE
ncbi:hypothetical protein MKX03_028654, partial [Papaver bracteatum]